MLHTCRACSHMPRSAVSRAGCLWQHGRSPLQPLAAAAALALLARGACTTTSPANCQRALPGPQEWQPACEAACPNAYAAATLHFTHIPTHSRPREPPFRRCPRLCPLCLHARPAARACQTLFCMQGVRVFGFQARPKPVLHGVCGCGYVRVCGDGRSVPCRARGIALRHLQMHACLPVRLRACPPGRQLAQ